MVVQFTKEIEGYVVGAVVSMSQAEAVKYLSAGAAKIYEYFPEAEEQERLEKMHEAHMNRMMGKVMNKSIFAKD